jgi:hypothetical protein
LEHGRIGWLTVALRSAARPDTARLKNYWTQLSEQWKTLLAISAFVLIIIVFLVGVGLLAYIGVL